MLTPAQRLEQALRQELPHASFDEHVIVYLANSCEGCTDDDVIEAWSPFLVENGAARSEDDAQTVARRILIRLCSGGEDASVPPAACDASERSAAPEADGATCSSPSAAGPAPQAVAAVEAAEVEAEKVRGLLDWLQSLRLTKYEAPALAWCDRMGAADVDEIKEDVDDFMDELQLRPLERKRVQKDILESCGGVAAREEPAVVPPHEEEGSEHEACAAEGSPEHPEVDTRARIGPPDKPYVILGEIGSGATATVHKCVREGEAEVFAVKTIVLNRLQLRADKEKMFERLHREMSIQMQLRHPHIVCLHDIHKTSNTLCLVMELVEGGDLYTEIIRHGPLGEQKARDVFLQLVDALKYIHFKGFVHRDLKPDNILLDRKETHGEFIDVKISDFGHSKLIDDGYSPAMTQVGTPQYWAPEVSDPRRGGKGYDERVDLWSLGVVLYVMLEGTYPFDRNDRMDMINGSCTQEVNIHFRSSSATSAAARDLISSLIRRRPEDRLPLDECLRHDWVGGSVVAHVIGAFNSQTMLDSNDEPIVLHTDPQDATRLKTDLQQFTLKFKVSAVLQKRTVIVAWGSPSSAPHDRDREAARGELMRILAYHVQGFQPGRQAGSRPCATGGQFRYLPNIALRVADGAGAGLDLDAERGGMRVIKVDSYPGQPGLQANDLIVRIDDAVLSNLQPDRVVEAFGARFRDGAMLSIRRANAKCAQAPH